MVLYSLGLRDTSELDEIMKSVMNGEEFALEDTSWTYEELCSMKLTLILPTDKYQKNPDGTWKDMSENEAYLSYAVEKGIPLKITGIARPNDSGDRYRYERFRRIHAGTYGVCHERRKFIGYRRSAKLRRKDQCGQQSVFFGKRYRKGFLGGRCFHRGFPSRTERKTRT